MKSILLRSLPILWTLAFATPSLLAYPPTPHHILCGVVRDELGDPLADPGAEVILETASGVQIKTTVTPNLRPGVNYQLVIPMDAGLTSAAYKPTALKPMVAFRVKVKIGNATFLPMEMTADYSKLGQPAQETTLNLTLGEDTDNDGLPDAWERMLIAMSGGALKNLGDVQPADDFDRDGLTNLQEYLLGTYAFDPQDGFRLDLVSVESSQPQLEFLIIRGRAYSLFASADLITWEPIQFRLASAGPSQDALSVLNATDTQMVRVQVIVKGATTPAFFKAQVR